jgi:hypothetical protein
MVKLAAKEFSRRPNPWVHPREPGALFVQSIPQKNWGKMMLEDAEDVGFLRLDEARREVLFEGDKERWRIPAASIAQCAVAVRVIGQGSHGETKVYYVILRANIPGGLFEAPLKERNGTGKFLAGRRKMAAERLFEDIRRIQTA